MKRSSSLSTSLTVGAITLLAAVPAFAQDYSADYSSEGEAAAALAGLGIWAFCCMIPLLLLSIFNVWMLIDAIIRQEHEYPNSTGNSKLIWILLLVFIGLLASIAYYFMVFRKIKRGQGSPPPKAGSAVAYQPPAVPPPAPPTAPPAPPAPPTAPPPPPPAPTAPVEPSAPAEPPVSPAE